MKSGRAEKQEKVDHGVSTYTYIYIYIPRIFAANSYRQYTILTLLVLQSLVVLLRWALDLHKGIANFAVSACVLCFF